MLSDLASLPSRGVFTGAVEGVRPLPTAGQGPTYLCCQDTPDSVVVHNASTRLLDLYQSARRRSMAAAAAAAASKRAATKPAADDRGGKRQQQQQAGPGDGAGGLASALELLHQPTKQQPARPVGEPLTAAAAAAAGTKPQPGQRQQQQQQQQHRDGGGSRAIVAGAAVKSQGPAAAGVLAARPNGKSAQPGAAIAAAGAGGGGGGGGSSKHQLCFTADELMAKTNKELTELLKAHHCRVAGKKEELVRRLLDYQRRVKKAAQASSSTPGGTRVVMPTMAAHW